jgi:hypothetical protein
MRIVNGRNGLVRKASRICSTFMGVSISWYLLQLHSIRSPAHAGAL